MGKLITDRPIRGILLVVVRNLAIAVDSVTIVHIHHARGILLLVERHNLAIKVGT